MRTPPNYFTNLIRSIRSNLIAQAAIDGQPEPTDDDVQTEMNRVFSSMEGRIVDNYVLRRSPIDGSWVIENVLFAPVVSPVIEPIYGSSFIETITGGLTLSSVEPTVDVPFWATQLYLSTEPPDVTVI